ncbi:MAG TPA: hypothetical protein VF929_12045 [Gemmatimonadaceae bacterium]
MARHGAGALLVRCAALCAVALLPVVFNAWIDPARILGAPADERAIVQALVEGHYVTDVMNYDDRAIERLLAESRVGAPDVLAIGSSRLQPLDASAFPGRRFVNASLANGRLDDMLGIYALYDTNSRRPRRLVVNLDPWTLRDDRSGALWRSLLESRERMFDRLELPHSALRDRIALQVDAWKRLASPEYFRLAVFSFRHYGTRGLHYTVTDRAQNVEKTKAPDGSIVWLPYSEQETNRLAEEYAAQVRDHTAMYDGRESFNASGMDVLERFLHYVRRERVEVDLLMAPFHPVVYAELAQVSPSRIVEAEQRYRELAARVGARVIGGFNPAATGMTARDFFDQSHMRPESLARLVAASTTHQQYQEGTPVSCTRHSVNTVSGRRRSSSSVTRHAWNQCRCPLGYRIRRFTECRVQDTGLHY